MTMDRILIARAGMALATLSIVALAWGQERSVSRREELAANRAQILSADLAIVQSDVGAVAQRIRDVNVRIARMRQQLALKASSPQAQLQSTSSGFDWSRLKEDAANAQESETQVSAMVLSFIDTMSVPDINPTMLESMGSQTRPVMERFMEENPESRWSDDFLLMTIWNVAEHDKNLGKARQMLDQAWAKRDQIRIEDELKATPLYPASPYGRAAELVASGQVNPDTNPIYLALKMELSNYCLRLKDLQASLRHAEDAYEMAGKPETGDLQSWYSERLAELRQNGLK